MPAEAVPAVDRIGPGTAFGREALSPGSLVLRVVLASAAIALLCVCARLPSGGAVTLPAGPPADVPFVPSTKAVPAPAPIRAAHFDLAEPGLDPVRVAARIDPRTGLREDALSRGEFPSVEAPALRVTLTRNAAARAAPTLFVLLARRAAGGAAIDRQPLSILRTGLRGQILTKFGAVETLDVTFAGTGERTCTGFVTRSAPFQLDGWLCAPLGRPPEPRSLACTLDALSLVDLADPETTAAFAAASVTRPACPSPHADEASGRTGAIAERGRNKK